MSYVILVSQKQKLKHSRLLYKGCDDGDYVYFSVDIESLYIRLSLLNLFKHI